MPRSGTTLIEQIPARSPVCGRCRRAKRCLLALTPISLIKVLASGHVSEESGMILVLIQILITVVVGAILFWLIDRFIRDGRLANLLKILVVLVCLASILQRLLPLLGIGF
jgi:hypothetical protein